MNYARMAVMGAILLAAIACGRKDAADAPGAEPDIDAIAAGEDTEPVADPAQPIFVGLWSADPSWCALAPGSTDAAPIVITEGEFIGYENRCRFGLAEEGTEGGWRLELVCEAEGVEYVETVDLDVDGETLRLSREGADEIALTRCPGK